MSQLVTNNAAKQSFGRRGEEADMGGQENILPHTSQSYQPKRWHTRAAAHSATGQLAHAYTSLTMSDARSIGARLYEPSCYAISKISGQLFMRY